MVYRLLVKRNRKEREDLGIYGRIILWLILEKWDGGAWTGCSWFRLGQVVSVRNSSI
jgi:hypothetical protein